MLLVAGQEIQEFRHRLLQSFEVKLLLRLIYICHSQTIECA